MAELLVYFHGDFKLHDPSPYSHPENPGRLERALRALSDLQGLTIVEPPEGDAGVYTSVHSPSYLKSILSEAGYGVVWLDADTYVSRGSVKAIRRLAGAAVEAVKAAAGGGSALILGRPPGHHAGVAGRALGAPTSGFCLVNTAALVARLLAKDHDSPVLVFDFDVHHGNGTQEIFWVDPDVIHIDIHQDPRYLYPGTGYPEDLGSGEARGTKINIVTPPSAGDDVYLHSLEIVEAIVREVSPSFIVFSAGFDAYRGDNDFAIANVGSKFYWEAARRLAGLARGVVAVLEGGYGEGLSRGLKAFAAGLVGLEDPIRDKPLSTSVYGVKMYSRALERLKDALKRSGVAYWSAVNPPEDLSPHH